MYKTEPHLHTKEVSKCSRLYGKEMAELYHKAGYQTIFVSDHMHQNFLEKNADVPKSKAIERFLSGYYNAAEAGKEYGMNVLLSVEYAINFGRISNHYLVYGIDESFLFDYANCESFHIEDLRKATEERGAMLIQAHPFRDICIPTPTYVDGMEIYNSKPRDFIESDEERTVETAKMFDLLFTAGSDAHDVEDIAGTGMGSDYEIKTAADYIDLIKSRKGIILKK